jgi:hypothetical protein
MRNQSCAIGTLFALSVLSGNAQWLNYPNPGTPRLPDGKPHLSATTPRAPNGRPDLSGVWRTEFERPGENERLFGDAVKGIDVPGDDPRTFSRYSLNILADFKPEESPLRPEAAELFRRNAENRGSASPTAQCLPQGVPRADLFNYLPYKMIQNPGVIVVLYELDGMYREIYTDGRKLPMDSQPSWLGYSVGRWDGDTLVVDAIGFNDKSWLDTTGHPHSEEMRLQERFHRRDFGHMELSVTVNDPKMYTRPFTVKVNQVLIPDTDVLENVCNENERDRPHLKGR